mmetsp:Transcript_133282/g.385784  ORF Transcript_133282/g.385784 Transcript_133282/m.385784 type:complete len:215 (-) Transcript_133282:233-877(-)
MRLRRRHGGRPVAGPEKSPGHRAAGGAAGDARRARRRHDGSDLVDRVGFNAAIGGGQLGVRPETVRGRTRGGGTEGGDGACVFTGLVWPPGREESPWQRHVARGVHQCGPARALPATGHSWSSRAWEECRSAPGATPGCKGALAEERHQGLVARLWRLWVSGPLQRRRSRRRHRDVGGSCANHESGANLGALGAVGARRRRVPRGVEGGQEGAH